MRRQAARTAGQSVAAKVKVSRRTEDKTMCDELPPPVTKNSSKAHLWAEIEAMQQEIEEQQIRINSLTRELEHERACGPRS